MYLFFDKDLDGKYLKLYGYDDANKWIIDDSKPSTTALQDLDEDGHANGCRVHPPRRGATSRLLVMALEAEVLNQWIGIHPSVHPVLYVGLGLGLCPTQGDLQPRHFRFSHPANPFVVFLQVNLFTAVDLLLPPGLSACFQRACSVR